MEVPPELGLGHSLLFGMTLWKVFQVVYRKTIYFKNPSHTIRLKLFPASSNVALSNPWIPFCKLCLGWGHHRHLYKYLKCRICLGVCNFDCLFHLHLLLKYMKKFEKVFLRVFFTAKFALNFFMLFYFKGI